MGVSTFQPLLDQEGSFSSQQPGFPALLLGSGGESREALGKGDILESDTDYHAGFGLGLWWKMGRKRGLCKDTAKP